MKNRAGTRTVHIWALSVKALNLHLSLDIPVLHPPAEYILASCPSTPCAVELAACNTFFEHSLKGTDVGALIRGIPAELKQTHSTSCHRATHTTDPMEAARIQRIYRYSLSMDIRPHIIVRPIHNGIADPLRLQFAALEQKAGICIIVVDNDLFAEIVRHTLVNAAFGTAAGAFRPADTSRNHASHAAGLFQN